MASVVLAHNEIRAGVVAGIQVHMVNLDTKRDRTAKRLLGHHKMLNDLPSFP